MSSNAKSKKSKCLKLTEFLLTKFKDISINFFRVCELTSILSKSFYVETGCCCASSCTV